MRFAVEPNLIRDRARVRFSIQREGLARLAVFDRSGRVVSSLVRTSLAPGEYLVNWNGRDNLGRRLAQGVYFVRLASLEHCLLQKVTKIR